MFEGNLKQPKADLVISVYNQISSNQPYPAMFGETLQLVATKPLVILSVSLDCEGYPVTAFSLFPMLFFAASVKCMQCGFSSH